VFIAPNQTVNINYSTAGMPPSGYALLFHPDLLHGTAMAGAMQDYSFFSYQAHEALHISERERGIVVDSFQKIAFELQQSIDKHSRKLIASNIELFLNYCIRFYDRQFITRDIANAGVVADFERLLNDYLHSVRPSEIGIPTVGYFASELHLSANYFGDLIRRETGQSAQEYIHAKLIEVAKDKLHELTKPVSEIAYELGFRYPQHFTRLFKQRIGQTPVEYRGAAALN
jgi:AraC-like DNA-binding protein